MENKTVIIYSGGLDSTILLYKLKNEGHTIESLGFNYGQKHKKELEFAEYHASKLKIPFKLVDLSSIKHLISNSSQTGNFEVPEGHYTSESMKTTVVPNRNMIMLSVAIGYAINIKFNNVAFAAHSGDHDIYPDCRLEFIRAINDTAKLSDWHPINVLAPFVGFSKSEIVKIGDSLGVEMSKTWSCYKGGSIHCGKCGTCVERVEAFKLNNMTDNTIYE